MAAVTLAAEQASYRVDGRNLLDQVSLILVPGEVHAVLGRNGAGKSTLLRLLAGDIQPQGGSVTLNGRALPAWTPRERARRRAVLPQSESLRFGFSAEQVVAMGRYASAQHRPEVEQGIVREALQLAGVADLAQRRYPSLSGGERARVQFARVMAQIWEPPADGAAKDDGARYLLLDEPTASLDLAHQHGCLLQARRFAASGVGVLAVLHDPNLALRYSDRVTVLENGRVTGQGPTRELLSRELLERTYGIGIELVHTAGEALPVVVAHPANSLPSS
ncbi:heme ABC transporter ATP-binding protein [Nevskia soli]|uniref:heme ABC transporter ATP-binding protein n=1 Tax=Nevskia soli TaxID=418856 RepID=UPI0004A7449C|nr:heme ABC transporter ATP-binding protein [Nevskia soli]